MERIFHYYFIWLNAAGDRSRKTWQVFLNQESLIWSKKNIHKIQLFNCLIRVMGLFLIENELVDEKMILSETLSSETPAKFSILEDVL